jgi:LysM repeat protein
VNDESSGRGSRGRTPADDAASGAPAEGAFEGAAPDDTEAALERLQSLAPGASSSPPVEAGPARRTAAVARPAAPAARSRPRPAAATSTGSTVARIAAPVVFLVAVIVLITIGFQSGVIGGSAADTAPASPTPQATKSDNGDAPKTEEPKPASSTGTYKVKSGDTLSGIAAQYDTTVSELESLNPDVSSSTLVVGQKLVVPTP